MHFLFWAETLLRVSPLEMHIELVAIVPASELLVPRGAALSHKRLPSEWKCLIHDCAWFQKCYKMYFIARFPWGIVILHVPSGTRISACVFCLANGSFGERFVFWQSHGERFVCIAVSPT